MKARSMRLVVTLITVILFSGAALAQIKNSDFLDLTVVETGKADDGTPVNYVQGDKGLKRALTGKEYVYYKTVIENVVAAMDAGWINSPNWKKRYDWKYGEEITNGLYRTKKQDEDGAPNTFVINNTVLPGKGHPLYAYFLKMNDSLYNPANSVNNPEKHLMNVQNYENNSPRLDMTIHINHLLKVTSVSEFVEMDMKYKTKLQYKVFKRNDSIWYKNEDERELDPSSLKYQKNTMYIVIGEHDSIGFTKGITDEVVEYKMLGYPDNNDKQFKRIDHIILELVGHQESINLFLSKFDWKKLEAAFKTKVK